jgi:hypothetical protein
MSIVVSERTTKHRGIGHSRECSAQLCRRSKHPIILASRKAHEIVHHQKTRQLLSLLESLLPRKTDIPELCSELEDLLDADPGETTLSELRSISIANGRHDHSWRERCPPDTVFVGDYGYMPEGGKDFVNFKVLGNIYNSLASDPCALRLLKEVEGTYAQWINGFMERKSANPYMLPDDLEG